MVLVDKLCVWIFFFFGWDLHGEYEDMHVNDTFIINKSEKLNVTLKDS